MTTDAIDFIGEYPPPLKVVTGLWSLDMALQTGGIYGASIGFPLRTLTELFGPTGVGKTTVALSLGAIIANKLEGEIVIAPFDNISLDMLRDILEDKKYKGRVYLEAGKVKTSKTKDPVYSHEQAFDDFIDRLKKPETVFGMVDTWSAVSPIAEAEGSVADANMGKRPQVNSKAVRKIKSIVQQVKPTPSVVIGTNHRRPNMGGFGFITPGGEAIHDHSQIRIEVKPVTSYKYDSGRVLVGVTKKYNFGKDKQKFYLFLAGGNGIHIGVTSIIDCLEAKVAQEERKVIKMDDKSYGKIDNMDLFDDELFVPFKQKLDTITSGFVDTDEEENEDASDG